MAATERDADIDAEIEALQLGLKNERRRLNRRERDVFKLFLEGYTNDEIAARMNEDVRVINYELNAVWDKVRHRLEHRK